MQTWKRCWNVVGAIVAAGVGSGCGAKEAPPAVAEVAPVTATETPTEPATQVAPAAPATPTEPAPQAAPATPTEPTEPAPHVEPAEPATPTEPEKKPAQGPRAKKAPTPEEKATAAAARRAFNRLLEEGRKAVKADDALTGMQKLQEALTKVPGHPTALAELGWAAYRAGPEHFERSLDATRKALSISRKPGQRGALFYNLGRVHEDKGELAQAVDAYRESLAVRPGNAVVEERLAALVAKLGGKSATDGHEKLEDLCMTLRTEHECATAASAEGDIVHSCECANELLGPEEGFGRAALVRITGSNEFGAFGIDATYLVVEVAARWHLVSMVGNDWTPGAFGVSNVSRRDAFEFRQGQGQPLLWVLYENTFIDHDMAGLITSSDWSRTLTVCGMLDGAMTCLGVPLGSGSALEVMELEGEEMPPDLPTPYDHRRAHTVTLGEDGTISIAFEKELGDPKAQLAAPAKGLTFGQLAAHPNVVRIPL